MNKKRFVMGITPLHHGQWRQSRTCRVTALSETPLEHRTLSEPLELFSVFQLWHHACGHQDGTHCHSKCFVNEALTVRYLAALFSLYRRAPSWITLVWYCSLLHMGQHFLPENFSNACKQTCGRESMSRNLWYLSSWDPADKKSQCKYFQKYYLLYFHWMPLVA